MRMGSTHKFTSAGTNSRQQQAEILPESVLNTGNHPAGRQARTGPAGTVTLLAEHNHHTTARGRECHDAIIGQTSQQGKGVGCDDNRSDLTVTGRRCGLRAPPGYRSAG